MYWNNYILFTKCNSFTKNVVDSKVFGYKIEFSQAHGMEFLCYEMDSQNQKFISQLK